MERERGKKKEGEKREEKAQRIKTGFVAKGGGRSSHRSPCDEVEGKKTSLTFGQFEIQFGELLPYVLRELADVDVFGHR